MKITIPKMTIPEMTFSLPVPKLTALRYWKWALLPLFAAVILFYIGRDAAPSAKAVAIQVFPPSMSLGARNGPSGATNFGSPETGLISCNNQTTKPTKCQAVVGQYFEITVEANVLPAGGYLGLKAQIGGLSSACSVAGTLCWYQKGQFGGTGGPCEEIIWPDWNGPGGCGVGPVPPTGKFLGSVGNGPNSEPVITALNAAGPGSPGTFTGNVIQLFVTCPAVGEYDLGLLDVGVTGNGTGYLDPTLNQVPSQPIGPANVSGYGLVNVSDTLVINCVTEINIHKIAQYTPPKSCYNVFDPLISQVTPLFQACDNDWNGTPPTNSDCIDGTHKAGLAPCSDVDPAVGSIRVQVLPKDYHIVESVAPPRHKADTTKFDCDATFYKCDITVVDTPYLRPWHPWDLVGGPPGGQGPDGKVRINDVSDVVQHYHQDKPLP